MQLTASFRREFTGVSRYRLSELPKGCPALNAVLGGVAHQYLFDLLALLFQKTAAACQAFQFVVEININLRSPLYLNRLLCMRLSLLNRPFVRSLTAETVVFVSSS